MSHPTVEALDLNSLAPGVVHRRWLRLVDDALGLPVRLPLLIARGRKPGPVLGLTSTVHGDEVNGVAVIHELFRKLEPTRLAGTVVGLPVTNVPAFHRHARRTPHGMDLNHHFPGSPTGNDIQVYSHRLLDRVVRHLDLLLDLHTASRGRANCLYVRADMQQPATARMAYLQRPQIILHNPASDGTLRGAASDLGVPAITVEVGNPSRFQREYIRRSVVGVRAVLAEYRMIKMRPVSLGAPPVVCASSQWLYTAHGGLLTVHPAVADDVSEGQCIAELVDAFGDPVASYTAPNDGIVIGRAVDPVAATGARVIHLGMRAADDVPYVRRSE
ncbi:MAG: putative deacylase [Myxococcota bacterium]|jgi:predicted deacylase